MCSVTKAQFACSTLEGYSVIARQKMESSPLFLSRIRRRELTAVFLSLCKNVICEEKGTVECAKKKKKRGKKKKKGGFFKMLF
ncbi:hypothetical protein POVWA2_056400 [Plasmodium ovale wallikeri]|uniref:Uncharacterized protein n=1 Tax=Plasmodium ovale wallikeri TaxID=864142 RepID=A0A1A8ZVE7_PLAOA|nr:hypothetical protein POVWA1_057010 [Plasmodium ovale wallikeri]SBT48552.1 hypothetical protein POVWA2_056400 [Plasmodium ovale wallikeri]